MCAVPAQHVYYNTFGPKCKARASEERREICRFVNDVLLYFEKEAIWTFDGKGELLLTIMSSLAQEESRSISENVTWGRRHLRWLKQKTARHLYQSSDYRQTVRLSAEYRHPGQRTA